MDNPILVELVRNKTVESWHRGAFVAVHSNGTVVVEAGDTKRAIYPRSTVKLFQALCLVESGAADAFGLGPKDLALTCASHNGSRMHREIAANILSHADLDENLLQCGKQRPPRDETASLSRSAVIASNLANPCSGKHAGMLATAKFHDEPLATYWRADHPVQQRIAAVLNETLALPSGIEATARSCGIDGCSVPTWPTPLVNLAAGLAKFATGKLGPTKRDEACNRIFSACQTYPEIVSDPGSICARLAHMTDNKAFVKMGTEGIYVAAIPHLDLGLALKVDDGADRAAQVMVAALVNHLFFGESRDLADAASIEQLNLSNRHIGWLRPSEGFLEILSDRRV